MADRTYNVVIAGDASFDEVKSKLENLGMHIARESRSLKFLSGSIAQELEQAVREVAGVQKLALDNDARIADC